MQLLRVEEEGGFVGRIESATNPGSVRKQQLDSLQQKTVTSYVANVTRLKRRLDWRIEQMSSQPLKSMHPVLLQILRLGEEPLRCVASALLGPACNINLPNPRSI